MPRSPMSSRNGWPERVWWSERGPPRPQLRFSTAQGEGAMRRLVIVSALGLAAASAFAQTKEPIGLRDMGSFHVGGRVIDITGPPIKEGVVTPRGGPAQGDPERKEPGEQKYGQDLPPQ